MSGGQLHDPYASLRKRICPVSIPSHSHGTYGGDGPTISAVPYTTQGPNAPHPHLTPPRM